MPIAPAYHLHRFATSRVLSSDAVDKRDFDDFVASLSPARKKFLGVLNEYKAANFEHDTPTRFFKMIVQSVDSNHDGVISMEEYQTLLKNIGAEEKMTGEDMREIFEEVGEDNGNDERVISVESLEERWSPFLHVMWKR
ncbi:hypothetical protein ACHAXT_004274 [Thalassiosira profunda]